MNPTAMSGCVCVFFSGERFMIFNSIDMIGNVRLKSHFRVITISGQANDLFYIIFVCRVVVDDFWTMFRI